MKKENKIRITRDEWIVISAIIIVALVLVCILPQMMNSGWFIAIYGF